MCGYCGQETEASLAFCTGCGTPLPGDVEDALIREQNTVRGPSGRVFDELPPIFPQPETAEEELQEWIRRQRPRRCSCGALMRATATSHWWDRWRQEIVNLDSWKIASSRPPSPRTAKTRNDVEIERRRHQAGKLLAKEHSAPVRARQKLRSQFEPLTPRPSEQFSTISCRRM